MEQNKTGRYFKYAIGEIILVVIGILIALQINNWNEQRKQKQQETTYYCKILEDLKADIVNIDISILSLDSRQEKAKTLLTNLLKVQNDKTILIKDYIPSLRSTRFVSTRAAIEDITSSGKLEILKNDAIKSAILKFYTHQDNSLTVISDNHNQLSQHIFDYITYTDFGIHEVPLYKENFGEELKQLLKSTDWQKDPSSNLFIKVKDHMNMTVIICEREKALLREMKESANQLKDLLESYCISNY
ncbi:DUF6090 family protein [Winogradskyella ursingii]|uniref:DUF6090 family protein n=1 Tax=Winogradskyella ursingii TaxID=2686079 RepID=UPI0015C89EA7|nr:DUF6090 family protein [Winogradskyella ursingii]